MIPSGATSPRSAERAAAKAAERSIPPPRGRWSACERRDGRIALVWAAVGKDPGFTPLSLLEQRKRRGRPWAEEVARLDLVEPFDLVAAKGRWLTALDEAERFVSSRPPDEIGCLYYSSAHDRFETPSPESDLAAQGLVVHYCRPGGVLPRPSDSRIRPD